MVEQALFNCLRMARGQHRVPPNRLFNASLIFFNFLAGIYHYASMRAFDLLKFCAVPGTMGLRD